LHERNELQRPGRHSLELLSGNMYIIEVHPSKVTASANVVEVPMSKRKCVMHSEPFNTSLVKRYTKKSCKVEHAIGQAIQEYHCIPWDAPFTENSEFSACKSDMVYLKNMM